MSEISTLSPALIWQWFDRICAIPHPSHHEAQLARFIIDWATSKNLFVEQDEAGNILIRKPATHGMENRQPVALQAHLDMVPQANADTPHNFLTDPILPYIDGDWVKARGTTLGADNGIGLASCLAVLDSDDLAHPALEVLLTSDEEVGMSGAIGLRPNWLQSEIMINTDTEDNGEIYIGCAGGENAELRLPLVREPNPFETSLTLRLKGLQGGHSGCDIHTNRVNAIKLLARLLEMAQQNVAFRLIDIQGGSVRNAIPREASASIALSAKNRDIFTACLAEIQAEFAEALKFAEKNLTIELIEVENAANCLTEQSSQTAIAMLNALPNGIIRQSDVVENVVETSLSIGVLRCSDAELVATILSRSLVESGKENVRSLLRSLAQLSGATAHFDGNYPGWEPDPNSNITPITKAVYNEILGYEAQIKVIHAGLECGLIKKIYPAMDLVSIGPTIRNAHSPDEKVHIPAVAIYWDLLTKLLAQVPEK